MPSLKRYLCWIIFLVLLHPNIQAQTPKFPSPWDGKRFNDTSRISRCDSLRKVAKFDWQKADSVQVEYYRTQMKRLYPAMFTMEWVTNSKMGIHRYIIHDGIIIELEKQFFEHGFILFLRDGIPIPEMRFYRLLTKYHPEQ